MVSNRYMLQINIFWTELNLTEMRDITREDINSSTFLFIIYVNIIYLSATEHLLCINKRHNICLYGAHKLEESNQFYFL